MLELVTGIVVAMVALAAVLEPLLRADAGRPRHADTTADDAGLADLDESLSPKIQALLALREIEFDRATGKLSETDYAALRSKYSESAVAAIRQEQAEGEAPPAEDEAEAMIARAKSDGLTSCPSCDNKLQSGSVFCSECGRSLLMQDAPMRCWICGSDLPEDAKFCGGCGRVVTVPAGGAAER